MSENKIPPMPAKDEVALPTVLRWIAGILGMILVVCSGCLLYWPPVSTTVDQNSLGHISRRISETTDVTTFSIATLLAGLSLIVFAMNGLRLIRLTVAGITTEAAGAAKSAQSYYTSNEDQDEENVEVPPDVEQESPDPTQPPVSVFGDATAIYELEDVPIQVIRDTLVRWPERIPRPTNLGEFEFASKKRGRGNHPWTLKFRGRVGIRVSYGGQGKTTGSVSPEEERDAQGS